MKLHEISVLCSISSKDLYREDHIKELLFKRWIILGTEMVLAYLETSLYINYSRPFDVILMSGY